MSRHFGLQLAVMLVAFGSPPIIANAQLKSTTSATSTGAIQVDGCRITLMDRVTLASPRAGVLAFVEAREGETVKAGQVLAGLDSSVAQANLAIAKRRAASTVDRRYAKKVIELSHVEYDRALQANQQLEGGGVFTEIDLRRLKLTVDKATLQHEQAENEALVQTLTVEQLQAELKTYSVAAPFGGTVTKVHRSKGEAVSLGDPIAEVVNLDRVRVEGFVGVRDGLRVRAGLPVTVRLDLPGVDLEEEQIELSGKLTFVDVGVEPVSGQVRVWAVVPNPDCILRAGLTARLTIHPPQTALKQ